MENPFQLYNMATLEEKYELVKLIENFHPGYGTESGFSYYIGGMMDTGGWFTRKLLEAPIEQLEALLKELVQQDAISREQGERRHKELERVNRLSPEEQQEFFDNERIQRDEDWKAFYRRRENLLI